MKHLESSYTNGYLWAIYMGKGVVGGSKVGTRSRICQNGWDVWGVWRAHAVTKLCLGLL